MAPAPPAAYCMIPGLRMRAASLGTAGCILASHQGRSGPQASTMVFRLSATELCPPGGYMCQSLIHMLSGPWLICGPCDALPPCRSRPVLRQPHPGPSSLEPTTEAALHPAQGHHGLLCPTSALDQQLCRGHYEPAAHASGPLPVIEGGRRPCTLPATESLFWHSVPHRPGLLTGRPKHQAVVRGSLQACAAPSCMGVHAYLNARTTIHAPDGYCVDALIGWGPTLGTDSFGA